MTTLVMLLHGFGSNGADLASLARYFAPTLPGATFLSPDGTETFDGNPRARQWFSIAGITEANRPERVKAARAALDALIDQAMADTKANRLILIGFSQGSIMALDAVARGKVAEVAAFAGRLAFTEALTPQPHARALLIGGTADTVMPPRLTTEAADRLTQAGVAAQSLILPGVPHTITAEGITAAKAFFATT